MVLRAIVKPLQKYNQTNAKHTELANPIQKLVMPYILLPSNNKHLQNK